MNYQSRRGGWLLRLVGVVLIIVGVILFAVLLVDDITIIGILDNLIAVPFIAFGFRLAFPNIRLPGFLGGRS